MRLLFILLLLTSCGPAKDRFRLVGEFSGISTAEFYVYSEDGAFEGIDTVRIDDGKFTYERTLTAPAVLTLLYPNYTQTRLVAEPGEEVTIKGEASKIGEAEIRGTEQNELLSDFLLGHASSKESDARMAAAQFVRDNAATLAAVVVFRKYFATTETPRSDTPLQLLDALAGAQPGEHAVAALGQFYRPIFQNAPGRSLPAFTAQTLDGRTVRSADYRGRRLVIACVATWQSGSRTFLRRLRERMRREGAGWQLLIVSLDTDDTLLRRQLQTDTVSAPTVCDRRAFSSPLVQTLGLRYVPSLMLVGADGSIVQRDVTDVQSARLN